MPPKPYAVFYHVWSPAGSEISRLLVDEQLKRVRRAGLLYHADVFCCVSGPQHDSIRNFLATYECVTVLQSTADESSYEGLTLAELFHACCNRPDLKAVAYIHTKGIRHFPTATPEVFKAVNSWRHFLEWGTIDRWKDAVGYLQTNDAVGVNYRSSPWPHFSGNFWWARSTYIRELAPPTSRDISPVRDVDVDAESLERLKYEKWLGTNNPSVFSFYDFPFKIDGQDWTFGFDLYRDDIHPFYEQNGL